jgi:alcohol dehydrogenase class IV
MGYWSQEYLMKNWGGPMVQSEYLRDAISPFFVPRIFSGFNLFLEKPDMLPDAVDLISRTSKKKKAFIVTDGYAVRFASKVKVPYEKRYNFKFQIWDGSKPDAPIETIKDCAEKMRKFGPDLIFAIGGGSSIDTAKAAWLLYEHPTVDIALLSPITPLYLRNKARLVAVPTTSGTGSEVSGISVVSFPDGVKLGMTGALPELVPDFALLDPTFTVGMPPELTAGTGGDALAHAIDGFMAPKANDLNQAIALKTIQMIFQWLPRAYRDGSDLMPRMKMQQAAMMAGIPLSNAGSGISHGLGHTIGGLFHIHHGVMVMLFIPYELQVYSRVTDRHLEICDTLGVRDPDSDEKSLHNLIDKIRGLMSELNLPVSLRAANVPEDDFNRELAMIMDRACSDPAFYFGWYDMTPDQLKDLFLCAYEGKLIDMNSDIWR